MLLLTLILMPLYGIFLIVSQFSYNKTDEHENLKLLKIISLAVTIINLIISLVIWLLFNNTSKHFQFVQEHYIIGYYDFYLGIDGLSIYFVLLTTLIMPISIISNWKSINNKIKYFLIIMLLLETLLLMILHKISNV